MIFSAGGQQAPPTQDEVERLMKLCQNLSETVAVLKERLKAAEEVVCGTKRERDCVTAEDWKRKAMHYEYQWRSCSEFANRRIGELTHNVEVRGGRSAEGAEGTRGAASGRPSRPQG